MFTRNNSAKTAIVLLSILIMLIVGCSIAEAPPVEQPQPAQPDAAAATQAESVEAQPEQPADAQPEKSTEAQVEPLDLGPNVDVQTVASVMNRDDVFLLDVREQWEYDAGHIAGNTLIPTGSIADRLAEIPKDKEVIIYCHSGARSTRVSNFLVQQGYTNIHNMTGGIVAWQSAGFDVEK